MLHNAPKLKKCAIIPQRLNSTFRWNIFFTPSSACCIWKTWKNYKKNFNFRHWCKQYNIIDLHFFPIFRTHIVRNCLSYWVQLVIYLNSNDKHAAKKNLFKFNIFFDQKMLQFFSFKFWKIWKWGIHRTIQSSKKNEYYI